VDPANNRRVGGTGSRHDRAPIHLARRDAPQL